MKKILALALAMLMVLSLCACGAKEEAPAAPAAPEAAAPAPEAPVAEGVTWADYQEYLIEKAGANAPDLDEFKGQVYAINSWEELDQTVSPWDQMFTTIGLSTWEEFEAGTVKEPLVGGPASGEASAEPAAEPAGEASGEPSEAPADVPASGAVANEAHGGTPGAVSEADYQAYLKAFLDYENSVNEQMTDEQVNGEFIPMIEAGTYDQFPVVMMFENMLSTGSAMTFDQFVAANGVY